MNLASLNYAPVANAGRPMPVMHPVERTPVRNGGVEISIHLLGQDSDTFISEELAGREKAVEDLTEGVKFSGKAADYRAIVLLAKCTVSWVGIPQGWIDNTDDETPAPFSFENAVKLYTNIKWLKIAVDKFIGNRANFSKASPAS